VRQDARGRRAAGRHVCDARREQEVGGRGLRKGGRDTGREVRKREGGRNEGGKEGGRVALGRVLVRMGRVLCCGMHVFCNDFLPGSTDAFWGH